MISSPISVQGHGTTGCVRESKHDRRGCVGNSNYIAYSRKHENKHTCIHALTIENIYEITVLKVIFFIVLK